MRKRSGKYNAVRCERDGFRFDSKAERDFYSHMKLTTPGHLDVHPVVTLPGPIYWKLDFVLYPSYARPMFVDVKGHDTDVFKIKHKLFDRHHPCAPLVVIRRRGRDWFFDVPVGEAHFDVNKAMEWVIFWRGEAQAEIQR